MTREIADMLSSILYEFSARIHTLEKKVVEEAELTESIRKTVMSMVYRLELCEQRLSACRERRQDDG
jgi:hypothetical protein